MIKTAVGIAQEEGVLKLWQGIHAQFLRHLVYSGTRIVTYRGLKENVFKKTSEETYYPVWKSALCKLNATSGALAKTCFLRWRERRRVRAAHLQSGGPAEGPAADGGQEAVDGAAAESHGTHGRFF